MKIKLNKMGVIPSNEALSAAAGSGWDTAFNAAVAIALAGLIVSMAAPIADLIGDIGGGLNLGGGGGNSCGQVVGGIRVMAITVTGTCPRGTTFYNRLPDGTSQCTCN